MTRSEKNLSDKYDMTCPPPLKWNKTNKNRVMTPGC